MSEAEELHRIIAQPFGAYSMPSASRHRRGPSPARSGPIVDASRPGDAPAAA